MALWGKSILSRRNNKHQGLEVRSIKEANMGRGVSKGRIVEEKIREVTEGRTWEDIGRTLVFR